MAKNGGSSWWKWLLGGVVLAAGGVAVAKALTTEPPRVPTFQERHGWDRSAIDSEGNYVPMPASALEEIRRDVQRYYAEKGLKIDAKRISVKDRSSVQIDASALSLPDKQKMYKTPMLGVSQYGLTGFGVDYGTAHSWEAIRGEAPAKK